MISVAIARTSSEGALLSLLSVISVTMAFSTLGKVPCEKLVLLYLSKATTATRLVLPNSVSACPVLELTCHNLVRNSFDFLTR